MVFVITAQDSAIDTTTTRPELVMFVVLAETGPHRHRAIGLTGASVTLGAGEQLVVEEATQGLYCALTARIDRADKAIPRRIFFIKNFGLWQGLLGVWPASAVAALGEIGRA